MNTEPRDPLMTAILEDDETFRTVTLRQTLALAASRRKRRTIRSLGVVATALFIGAAVFWRPMPRRPIPIASEPPPKHHIVHSAPLPAKQIVRSQAGAFALVASKQGSLAIVETRRAPPSLQFLDDRQLLAALREQRAVLVGAGTPEARIVSY